MEEQIEFKARKETVNGKETLVIEPIAEVTRHPDGTQDVNLIMPSLSLISQFKEEQGIK